MLMQKRQFTRIINVSAYKYTNACVRSLYYRYLSASARTFAPI